MSLGLETAISALLASPKQSTKRLVPLADHLFTLFAAAGLPNVQGGSAGELSAPGLTRAKDWDVAFEFAGKFRLLISLKSMLANISGSVPNRLDDLQGELANVQQLRPEIVIGYVILFDVAGDSERKVDGQSWSDYFESCLRRMAIRRAPMWNQGLLESLWFIRFDSRLPAGSRLLDANEESKHGDVFIRSLLCELLLREPAVPFTIKPDCP